MVKGARKFVSGLLVVFATASAVALTADPAAADGGAYWHVVNAGGGIYWRASPNWADAIVAPGHGIYNGNSVHLVCYSWGGPGPDTGNPLWYFTENLSRTSSSGEPERGWVNDHFLNTPGTAAHPQPQTAHC